MSSSRALSFDILHLGRVQHRLSEMAAQFLRHLEIHLVPAKQSRQAHLHACVREEPRDAAGRKLHQHVDVAVGPEVVPQRRADTDSLAIPLVRQNSASFSRSTETRAFMGRVPILPWQCRFQPIARSAEPAEMQLTFVLP